MYKNISQNPYKIQHHLHSKFVIVDKDKCGHGYADTKNIAACEERFASRTNTSTDMPVLILQCLDQNNTFNHFHYNLDAIQFQKSIATDNVDTSEHRPS